MTNTLILIILLVQLPVFLYAYFTAGSFVINKLRRVRRANTIKRYRRERDDS